jgi:hypothetical protein
MSDVSQHFIRRHQEQFTGEYWCINVACVNSVESLWHTFISPELKSHVNRSGITTTWDIISHMVVNHPYQYLCLLTKWEIKSVQLQMRAFSITAHYVRWRDKFLGINIFIYNDLFEVPLSNYLRRIILKFVTELFNLILLI